MPFEINTHNISNVDSIANVVFLAGKNRLASTTSTFMFHGVSFGGNNNERLEEKNLLEKLDIITAEHKRIATIISGHSALSFDACTELFLKQETRSAQWAVDNGIATGIGEFQITNGNVRYLV
jgi:ATP-dependent Clp protease protease subunit